MKKFLIFLAAILTVTGIGFGTYFLVKDNESFKVIQTTIYLDEGDSFEIDYEWADQKIGSKFVVEVDDSDIVKHLPEKSEDGKEYFTALSGGHTVVLFKPSNANIDNIVVNIYVGDGSLLSPFYIGTSEQLLKIGNEDSGELNLYTLDKYYKQINDIDMAGVKFVPIGAGNFDGFTGEYEGNGYKVSNITIDQNNYAHLSDNIGMFDTIGVNGRVVNLKVQNALLKADENSSISFVGTIAGANYGEVERVEIISSTISVKHAQAIGGVVGGLFSSDNGPGEEHTRHAGEIDRVGVNQLTIGVDYVYNQEGDYIQEIIGSSGAVGGIAGEAIGGVIVYSYVKGDVYLNNETYITYGGLVGYSENIHYSDNPENKYTYTQEGIRIRDSYSSVKLNLSKFVSEVYEDENIVDKQNHINQASIGGVVGVLHDELLAIDTPLLTGVYKIFGTFYNQDYFENQSEIFVGLDGSFDKSDLDLSTGIGRYLIKGKSEIGKDKLDPRLGETNEKEEIYFPHNYETFIWGMSSEDFTIQENFVSHYQYDRVLVGSKVELEETLVYWNFESPWRLSDSVNGGYPYLNYENVLLSNSVEAINKNEIHNAEQLQNMRLDGHYVIVNDIVWPKNPNEGLAEDDEAYDQESTWQSWMPIGDERRPFTGSLQSAYTIDEQGNKRLFTISNLVVDPELLNSEIDRKYGGLFGVTSAESGGYIKNLVFKEAKVSGYLTSGILVGSNGYEETAAATGKTTIHKGLDINNITVLSSTIDAVEVVGGIAGKNYGSITGGIVTEEIKLNEENLPMSVGKTKIKLSEDTNMNAVGGIAGYNQGTITRSFVEGGTEISADESASIVRVGGIAGRNIGGITESGVYGKTSIRGSVLSYKPSNNENGENQVIDTRQTSGLFGGIAGEVYADGYITKSFVTEISISADFKDNTIYVGGVAGRMSGNNANISIVSVKSVALTGYAVGGAIGEMDMNRSYNYTFEKDGNIQISDKNLLSMTLVEVKDSSVLTGTKVGGLISVMRNGIVSRSFVRETALNGVDANSFKAGLVAELPRVILPAEKAGVIQEVYVATTFGGEGRSYAMSQSEFLQTPIIKRIPFTEVVFEKPHGFVVNYLFDNGINGKASQPKTSNWFELQFSKITHTLNNLINLIPKYGKLSAKSTADMFIKSSYTEFGFPEKDVWNYSASEARYPELQALVGLEESLVKNNVVVTLPNNDLFAMVPLIQGLTEDNSVVENDNLSYTYKLNNSESFFFELQFSPDVNVSDYVITVTVDEVALNPIKTEFHSLTFNTTYLFKDTEIIITITNK